MMDSIQIQGIRSYGYTGYLEEERILGQWFEVNLTLWLDLSTAGESDDLNHTLDYTRAIATVKEIISSSKFALVEKLASAIAQAILDFDLVEKVRVQLSKPHAPIPDFGGNIIIDITRS